MRNLMYAFLLLALFNSCASGKKTSLADTGTTTATTNDGWISLFDGKTLNGWRAAENPASFRVDSGAIIVHGPRAHLFYEGTTPPSDLKNFELKVKLKTMPSANSGIFIHTAYQENGWPQKGYEVQVNNSHTDWRRTGSLYGVDDVREVYVKDGEWYTEYIKVEGNNITIKVNDRTVVNYNEPDSVAQKVQVGGKRLSSGTIALQAHDPNSVVYYQEVLLRPLK